MKLALQRILLAASLAILLPVFVCGQSRLDTLEQQLATSDTIKGPLLKQLSQTAFESGDYSSAIYYLQKEISFHPAGNDSVAWANAHYSLGMVYTITMNYQKAREHSVTALKYFERNSMAIPVANTCINLGYIQNELKQPDKAYNYYNRALGILLNLMKQQEIDASYYNLGVIGRNLSNMGNFKRSFQESLAAANKFNSASLSMVYSALSILNMKKNDLVKAEEFARRSLEISTKNNDANAIAHANVLLGKVLFKKGANQEAYEIIEDGLATARSVDNRAVIMDAYSELSRIAMALNQPGPAYSFLDQYTQLKDSMQNEQMAMQLSNINRRFEIADNNMDPALLLRQNLDQTLNIKSNTWLKIGFGGAVLLILVLLVLFLIRYNSKSKSTSELKEKTKVIEEQKNHLEELIQTKDRFLSIIAHDLKNPFNSLLGFADLAYNDFDDISDTEKKSYLNIIRQSGQHIYALLDNLLSWSRAQSGRIDFYPEPVSLTETIENSVEIVRGSADNKQIALFTDFSKDVFVKADKNMLSTVLRNLLTNAIKFTPTGGSVTVSSRINNKKVTVSVTDTGIGMTQEEMDKLFKLDGGLKNSGTANETGTGLGLILCQEFMSLHKSKIVAESTSGKGSTFSFTLDYIQQL